MKPAIFQADISDLHPKPIRVHPSLIETFEFPAKFSPFWLIRPQQAERERERALFNA